MGEKRNDGDKGTETTGRRERHIPERSGEFAIVDRTVRSSPPPYRWVCPCQEPPVLLATYDPAGRLNIKVRDRYWHLFGFGHVQAICPKCGAEHLLDMRALRKQVTPDEPDKGAIA